MICQSRRSKICSASSDRNGGRLSKRARKNEFAELTEDEVTQIEELYGATFGASETDHE